MLTAAGAQIGLDHKEATRPHEGRGLQPVWVWFRAGCLEEGASEQQIRPRVHPTLCDICLWLPWFPILSWLTPHPRNPDQWVGYGLESATWSNQANRTLGF